MSSINTVSAGGGKKYISGLVSGMDTESMVQNLLSGTQSKIDKQTGLKQQLGWKQDIYRDLISKINSFGDKYFSYYGKGNTNMMSTSLYNTMTGTSSSGAVKIGAVSSGAVSGMTITSIEQLATACTIKSSAPVTGSAAGSSANLTEFQEGKEYSFTMNVDGVNRTIAFTGAGSDTQKTLDNINQVLYRNFGTAVGFKEDSGAVRMVRLNSDGTAGSQALDPSRRVIIDAYSLEQGVTIANLGFSGGFSNKLDYGTSIKNMNFAVPLEGGRYDFEINGVKISGLTGDSTLSDVLSAINNSGAGVRVSYSSVSDSFVMESSSTGDISNITMSQTHGNLLTMMFGVEASGVESSLLQHPVTGQGTADMETLISELNEGKDKSFVFQVDGKDVTITLAGKTGSSKYESRQSVIDALNSQLSRQFGTGKITVSLEADPTDPDQNRVVMKSSYHQIGFTAEQADGEMAKAFGFTGENTNLYDENGALADMGLKGMIRVNGTDIDLDSLHSVKDLVDTLNGTGSCTAQYKDGRLEIMPAGGKLNIEGLDTSGNANADGTASIRRLFGTGQIQYGPGTFTNAQVTAGKNAVLTVDGTRIERNSNTFDLSGITITIQEKYDSSKPPISLTTARDTGKIVETVKGFVEDYNKLIDELNDYLTESATYKKYPPLTDAQKKEMSDREVELWEEKSKTGLLRNDPNVTSFLSDMRMALYSKVEGAGLSLYDIGVETSDNWRDNGKLVIDEDALEAAVATNADSICKLFTDKEQGLGLKMQNAIKSAANLSSGSPGSMVLYAGTKDVLTTSNTLYDEMKRITELLSNLNVKYEQEKSRYWQQFTAMEKAISNMNSQSSWLAQQFSS